MLGWRLKRGTGLEEKVLPRLGGVRLALGAVLYTVRRGSRRGWAGRRLAT